MHNASTPVVHYSTARWHTSHFQREGSMFCGRNYPEFYLPRTRTAPYHRQSWLDENQVMHNIREKLTQVMASSWLGLDVILLSATR